MIDEVSRRRDGFDEENSVRIALADGQSWAFPQPMLELRTRFEAGKPVGIYPVVTCGRDLDALIEAMSAVEDTDTLLIASATLGAYLLRKNYDLTDADLDTLLCIRPGDPSSMTWVDEVIEVATGQHRPKPSAVGCG